MIRVLVTEHLEQIQMIEVKGHAYSADPGQDLVCAGASTISFGGINALDSIFKNDCDLVVDDNRIKIEVKKTSVCLQSCLHFMSIQYEMMAETYPNYIKVTRKEV